MDIEQRFSHFIAHIRPSREQLEEANRQAVSLREQLTECIARDGKFHLERIFRAGSTAKHTDLIRTEKDTFDIDLGVYYRAQGRTTDQLSKLLPYTQARLREIYPPEKLQQDFHVGKNAVNVLFRTSGLKIDVVPIIRDGTLKRKNSGWIPREDEWRLTSITAHIHFVHTRTARSKQIAGPVRFNHLVRLMKWWNRRLPESLKQCSYFCELITAAALEEGGVTGSWQSSLCQIFAFVSQHAFSQPIIFHDYYNVKQGKWCGDYVVVLDAVNPENNLARKWNEGTRRGYLNCVQQTYEHVRRAQDCERKGDEQGAMDAWCHIFGNEFQRLSQ
jgi:SMODS domain-containing protein